MTLAQATIDHEFELQGGDATLDAAASIWALLEAAEATPSTPETRDKLSRARSAFDAKLQELGIVEQTLLDYLRRIHSPSSPPKPPDGSPTDRITVQRLDQFRPSA